MNLRLTEKEICLRHWMNCECGLSIKVLLKMHNTCSLEMCNVLDKQYSDRFKRGWWGGI